MIVTAVTVCLPQIHSLPKRAGDGAATGPFSDVPRSTQGKCTPDAYQEPSQRRILLRLRLRAGGVEVLHAGLGQESV